MTRKKKAHKSKSAPKQKNKSAAKPLRWKKLTAKLAFFTALVSIVGIALAVYGKKLSVEQDLSVLGNGVPTVVQVHDPGCQLCQQLKRNVDRVKGDYKDKIQFKVANIQLEKGRLFTSKHQVNHVTLVLFDARGNRVDTVVGVTSPADIRKALDRLLR